MNSQVHDYRSDALRKSVRLTRSAAYFSGGNRAKTSALKCLCSDWGRDGHNAFRTDSAIFGQPFDKFCEIEMNCLDILLTEIELGNPMMEATASSSR